jgi:hypothetical protein
MVTQPVVNHLCHLCADCAAVNNHAQLTGKHKLYANDMLIVDAERTQKSDDECILTPSSIFEPISRFCKGLLISVVASFPFFIICHYYQPGHPQNF